MKYLKITGLLLFIGITVLTGCKDDDGGVAPPEPPPPVDSSWVNMPVKDLVKQVFPDGNVFFGVASHQRLMGTPTMDTVDAEFGYVTPANDFKQTYIHPVPDKWQWEKSDDWVEHCSENGQIIRMHSPISPQCSKWVREDDRTPQELDTMLHQYVTGLCERYNGQEGIVWMDVVNETIDKKTGEWFGPKPGVDRWENPWPLIGYDSSQSFIVPLYIKTAFSIANQKAPDVKQIINQHGKLEQVVWTRMKYLVEYLRNDYGLRVDGIGWQAHIDMGWEKEEGNLERLDEIVKWCHKNNLAFHITEFNVWLKEGNEGKWQDQANTFTAIISVLLDNSDNGVVGINFWQIRPQDTQHEDWDGCLFDKDLNPKPALYAVRELINSYKSVVIPRK